MKRSRLAVAFALPAVLSVLLAGCGNRSTVLPPTPLKPFHPLIRVIRLWSHQVGSGAGKQRYGLVAAVGETGHSVFAASRGGRVAAWRAKSGRLLWSVRVGQTITAGPGAGDGRLAVVTRRGWLIVLNAHDGHQLWRKPLLSFALAPPVIASRRVIVQTGDSRIWAFTAGRGRLLWKIHEHQPHLLLRGTARPIVTRQRVYAGFNDGHVMAILAATGHVLWHTTLAYAPGHNEVQRMIDVAWQMARHHHQLFAANDHGRLVCLSTRTGKPVWSRHASSLAGLGVGQETIYVTDSKSIIRAYDRTTGLPIWTNPDFLGRRLTAPVPFGPAVVTGDLRGWVEFLARSTGHLLDRVRAGDSAIEEPPVADGGRLFVLTAGGRLVAYRLPSR
jgi:outer membrane protein assembly factor BamB